MSGRRHLTMTVEMLRSVGLAWSRIPDLIVASDGSIGAEELKRALSWWPAKVAVRMPAEYIDAANAAGRPEVAEFARQHVFGVKFAAMLHEALKGPVMWSDTDILYTGDLMAVSKRLEDAGRPIYAAEDWMRAYDERLASTVAAELGAIPNVSSGLCWMSGDIYRLANLGPDITEALKQCAHFTEQTLVALATARCGEVFWTRNLVLLDDSDRYSLVMRRRGANFVARHYLTPHRHLFWRDAMALRLTGGPGEADR